MNTLVVIFAHAGVEEIVRRHFPVWARHEQDLLILSPTDRPIRREIHHWNLAYLNSGQSQYAGPRAISRFKTAFNWMTFGSYDQFLIFEYDAFCLAKEIPNADATPSPSMGEGRGEGAGVFWGNQQSAHRQPWSLAFKTPNLFYAPWLLSKSTLEKLCHHFQLLPDTSEGGCFDRYLDLALTSAGIRAEDWAQQGFAMESITAPVGIDAMRRAIKYGATMLHGLKTELAFNAALEAYDARCKFAPPSPGGEGRGEGERKPALNAFLPSPGGEGARKADEGERNLTQSDNSQFTILNSQL